MWKSNKRIEGMGSAIASFSWFPAVVLAVIFCILKLFYRFDTIADQVYTDLASRKQQGAREEE